MKRIKEYKKLFKVDGAIDLKELKITYRGLVKEWHPDKFQEEEKKKEALRKQKDRSEQQKKAEQKKSQTPIVDNSKIFVKGFRFEGEIKLFPVSYLHDQVSEYINRNVTFEEIQSAKDKVGKFFLQCF